MNKYSDLVTKNGVFRYKTSKKEKVFKGIVMYLVKWWIEANPGKDFNDCNDLGILKVSKLLFFVCASNTDLLKVFSFWANPLGHEEKDVSELIRFRKGNFGMFTISTKKITINGGSGK